MQKELTIRDAATSDAGQISHLLAQMNYDDTNDFIQQRIAQMGEMPNEHLFVMEFDSKVIAFLSMHITPQLALPYDFARIVYFSVDNDYRSKGIGKRMLEHAEETARNRGCKIMELHSSEYRMRAHSFYHQNGYVENPKYFYKDLQL